MPCNMKRNNKRLFFLILLLAAGLVFAGCRQKKDDSAQEASTSIRDMDPANLDEITLEGMVDDILSQMTLEEKLGQMFLVSTDSLVSDVTCVSS